MTHEGRKEESYSEINQKREKNRNSDALFPISDKLIGLAKRKIKSNPVAGENGIQIKVGM